MISIIVCSVDTKVLERFKQSTMRTIGVEHEFVVVNNKKNTYGICAAYNLGAAAAKYDCLCFVHEDVLFHTMDWGIKIIQALGDPEIGAVGIAGGDSFPDLPATWSVSARSNEIRIVQHYKRQEKVSEEIYASYHKEQRGQVIALDGVFICTRKSVHQQFAFDEKNFPGFHGYDVDFTFQISRQYKVFVLFDIQLEHFSEGNQDKTWLETTFVFYSKWQHMLPASIHKLSDVERERHHWVALQVLLGHMKRLRYSYVQRVGILFRYGLKRFNLRNFLYTFRNI